MRPSRDLIVVLSLFVVLAAFTIVPALRRAEMENAQENEAPYSTHSARADGTLALLRWAEAIGYRTQRIENDPFRVPEDARLLFVFPPSEAFAEFEAQAVLRWVERGNTLVVVGHVSPSGDRLLRDLRASIEPISFVARATLEQPLSIGSDVQVSSSAGLNLERGDYVEYLSGEGSPLLVGWIQGKGKVYLSSTPFVFTNAGLLEESNAQLVRALLGNAPAGSLVSFDEYHQGFSGQPQTIQALLYNHPWGWAIILSLVVVFAFLFVNGQRFGRVMPLPSEIARRSPAEYVQSMAQLFRRAGKRRMILQHYRQQLKRSLGKPYQLNASIPDDEFVSELARYRELDREALLRTLRALDQHDVGERTLVTLASEAINLRRSLDKR